MKLSLNMLFRSLSLLASMKSQKGAFSPFMFGLLMAVGVLSAMTMQWAKQDLIEAQKNRAAKNKLEAEDIAEAIKFSILTETANTYDSRIDRDKILANTSLSQGKTRGGEDIQIVARDSGSNFNLVNQRVAIGISDDVLQQSKLSRSGDAEALSRAGQNGLEPVVIVDTGAVRQQQVSISRKRLEGMAEQIYQFYSSQLRFPTESEYEELERVFNASDVWGTPFNYTYMNNENAQLEFITPWNYTSSIKLSLE